MRHLLIASVIALTLPAQVSAAPAPRLVRSEAAVITSARLTYQFSARETALKRSYDSQLAVQSREIDRLITVQRQLRNAIAEKSADRSKSEQEIQALESRIGLMVRDFNDRLAAQDAEFALARARFIEQIGPLLNVSDPDIRQALTDYAAGNGAALNRLGELIGRSSALGTPEQIVLTRSFAVLAADAARQNIAETAPAIEAWEHVLQSNPGDTIALNRLTWLYAQAGRPEDAKRIAAKAASIQQPAILRAMNLTSQGNLALQSKDYGTALRSLREAVALFTSIADPGSPDALRVLNRNDGTSPAKAKFEYTLWIHAPLAGALRSLSQAEHALHLTDQALRDGQAGVMHGEIVTEAMTRNGKNYTAYWAYLGNYMSSLARIELEAGLPDRALATYERASATLAKGNSSLGAEDRIDAARSALMLGRLDVAGTQLDGAKTELGTMQVGAYALGVEGMYWEQLASLRDRQARHDDSQAALINAQLALAKAIRIPSEDKDRWDEALARVKARLSSGETSQQD